MPTYQYACTECDHSFDQVQSFADSSLTECPECRGRLRKLFNAVGVVFKGSGFYRNDSRPTSSESSSESKSDSKSDSSSDTKTEKKTEAKSEKKAEKKSDSSSSAPAST